MISVIFLLIVGAVYFFFFQAEDGIRDDLVTGVQTCALPIFGPALGTLIGGILLAQVGWRMFFVVLGTVSLLWLAPWLRWMPRSYASQEGEKIWRPSTLQILR